MEMKNKLCDTQEITVLTREQHDAIRNASYKHPLGFLIRFLMYTGITVTELRVLSWRDLDLQRNHLYVPRVQIPTDNGLVKYPDIQCRYVPLLPFLRMEILEWEFVQKSFCTPYELNDETGPAFATTLDGEPLWPEDIERIYLEILDMCGIPAHPIHVLRDTYAVFTLGCGVSPYSVNEIMGDPNAAEFYGNYMNTLNNTNRRLYDFRKGW